MYSTHGSTAVARADHRIEVFMLVVNNAVIVIKTNSADHGWLVWNLRQRRLFFQGVELLICNSIIGHLGFCSLLFSRACFEIFDGLNVQPIQETWWPYEFNTTIEADVAFSIHIDVSAEVDIVWVHDGVLRPASDGAERCLVALGPLRSRTLAPLGFEIWLHKLGWFGIVNISDSEPDPAHPYNRVFHKFESFRFVRFLRVFVHNVPKLFLWVGIYRLQVNLVFMEDPVSFLYPIFFLGFLIHYPT